MDNEKAEEREVWIDNSKAIGIALVIWGHFLSLNLGSHLSELINVFLYSFHIPMFFVLAGYNAKNDNSPFGSYLKKKWKRVLRPSVVIYLISIPLYVHEYGLDQMKLGTIFSVVFYGKGLCIINEPIWFFICLFQVYFIAKLINLINHKTAVVFIFSLLFCIAGYVSTLYPGFSFYLGINRLFIGMFYFCIGVLFKRYDFVNRMKTYVSPLLIIIWLLCSYLNGKVSLYGFRLGYYLLYVISGISGTMLFFITMKTIKRCPPLVKEYAENTVFIICIHMIIVKALRDVLLDTTIVGTICMDIILLLLAIIVCCALLPASRIVNKYIPILNGR